MKNRAFWLCFTIGFLVSFIPFLFPNGWLFILMPWLAFPHIAGFAFHLPFAIALIQAIRGKDIAYGWIFGSIASVITGFILAFSIGFGFVPV